MRHCGRRRRLSFGKSVGLFEQHRQIIEVDEDFGVLGAEAFFIDGERAAHQRLGLGKPVRGFEKLRQIVEGGGIIRGVVPSPCLDAGSISPG